MKKRFKRVGAAFLSLAMILGIMPGVTKPIEVLAANSEPATAYWTEVSSLKTGYNLNGGTIANIRFGESDRKWAICGADGNDLALISTSQFTTAAYDSTSPYASKYSTSDFVTGIDTYLSTTYFSETELTKMQDVAVRTLEYDQSGTREANGSTVTLKLYLPDAASRYSYGSNSIFVGKDNNIEIALSNLSVTTSNGYFWLRSPSNTLNHDALVASPGGSVSGDFVDINYVSVVPAFNLNLSSVIFASAAKAASSAGEKTSEMTASTYTLRYAPTDNSWDDTSAVISADKTSVQVSGASSGMYLMVQNSDGVYAVDASSNSLVSASSITIDSNQLTDFNNCRVWLESTDASNRITTAKLITPQTETVENTGDTCDHDYEFIEITSGTTYTDGEYGLVCKKCGQVKDGSTSAISAYTYMQKEAFDKIMNAPKDGEVVIDTAYWTSFTSMLKEAMKQRPDVTITINYTYNHVNYTVTIPKGTDPETIFDKNGYCGFRNLDQLFSGKERK